jgi:peptidoglycan/LPS O-acetylase OafA/YrhL
MKRWPPLLWLCVSCGSLLILVGLGGEWNPVGLIPGILIVLVSLGISLYLAYGRPSEHPRASGVSWLVPATAVFYVAVATAAAFSGSRYVMAAVAAAGIPLAAAALIVATSRSKTAGSDDARGDTTAADDDDPLPGIGMDENTPLGDTAEHSDAERVAAADRRFDR